MSSFSALVLYIFVSNCFRRHFSECHGHVAPLRSEFLPSGDNSLQNLALSGIDRRFFFHVKCVVIIMLYSELGFPVAASTLFFPAPASLGPYPSVGGIPLTRGAGGRPVAAQALVAFVPPHGLHSFLLSGGATPSLLQSAISPGGMVTKVALEVIVFTQVTKKKPDPPPRPCFFVAPNHDLLPGPGLKAIRPFPSRCLNRDTAPTAPLRCSPKSKSRRSCAFDIYNASFISTMEIHFTMKLQFIFDIMVCKKTHGEIGFSLFVDFLSIPPLASMFEIYNLEFRARLFRCFRDLMAGLRFFT